MAPSYLLFPHPIPLPATSVSLLLLLAFGPVTCSVDPQEDSPSSGIPRSGRHPLPPTLESAVVSDGDMEHPRVAYDALGRDKVSGDDDWMAPWGRRKKRGKAVDGGVSTLSASVVAPRNSCKDLRSKRYISDGFCTSSRPLTEAVCADKCCSTPASGRQRPRGQSRNPHKHRPSNSASPSLSASQSNYRLQPWYADYVKVWARGQNEMNSVIAAEVGGGLEDVEGRGGDGVVGDRGVATAGGTPEEDGRVEWRCVEDAVRRRRVRLLCRDGSRRTYQVRLVKSCKCVQRRRQRVAEKRRRRGRGRRRGRRKMARGGGGWRRARWAVD